jgi:transposase
MVVCGSFHHWAQLTQKHGHIVKGMSPKYVKPFISKQKTDANDADVIASFQISMPLCQVKTVEQQSLQSLQVSRKWFDKPLPYSVNICGHYVMNLVPP